MSGLQLGSIMVPLDSSELAEHALPTGALLAGKAGVPLHLVSVQDPLVTPFGMEFPAMYVELLAEQRQHLVQYLTRASEAALREGAPTVRTAVLDGIVARELGRYILTEGIDLVVMTTHGRGGLNRLWLGSVADRLLRTVRAPLLLLRPSERAAPLFCRKILVALDGEIEQEVVDAALGLATLVPEATLVLTRIVEPPIPGLTRLAVSPAHFGSDWTERHEIEARTYLSRLAERLRLTGHTIETQVVVGRPVPNQIVNLALAIDADLIVMGTHGARGFERLILGSVADKVTRISDVPLLIAPVRRVGHREETVSSNARASGVPVAVGSEL